MFIKRNIGKIIRKNVFIYLFHCFLLTHDYYLCSDMLIKSLYEYIASVLILSHFAIKIMEINTAQNIVDHNRMHSRVKYYGEITD